MLSAALEAKLKPRTQIFKILWSALTFSIALYVVIAYMVAPEQQAGEDLGVVRIALYVVASLVIVASFVLPTRMLPDERIRKVVRKDADTVPEEDRLMRLIPMYFTPFILRLALNEAVAVFGLVLSMMTADPTDVLPFAGGALLLNLLAFPNFERLFVQAR